MDPTTEPWTVTIVRTQGAEALRPEKSWRPIVTLELGDDLQHEVQLGCDGRNPNLKLPVVLHGVDGSRKLRVRIWHQSQSKKKKSRNHVASGEICLLNVLKRLGPDASAETEIPLARDSRHGTVPRRVKGQRGGASLHIRVRAPSIASGSSETTLVEPDMHYLSDPGFSDPGYLSDVLSNPASPTKVTFNEFSSDAPTGLRRRRKRGYHLHSDTEASEWTDGPLTDDDCDPSTGPPSYADLSPIEESPCSPSEPELIVSLDTGVGWIAASLLPRYVDQISVASTRSTVESALDAFTPYEALRQADESGADTDFERVLERLKTEWYGVGASLIALAGLNAAVFGFSDESIFQVNAFGVKMIALSSVASGFGLFFISLFITKYSFADVRRFQARALDLYGTYFFFSLSCRLPTLCMFISASALMAFLVSMAWHAWPQAVLAMSFFAGLIVSLQYLVFGVHWAARLFARSIRAVRRRVLGAVAPRSSVEEAMVGVAEAKEKRQEQALALGLDMGPAGPRCVIAEALAQSPVQQTSELPEITMEEKDVTTTSLYQ